MKTTAFKNTDIGPIPEDWETSPIGVICDIQLGKMLDEEKNIGEPKPYLGNRAVQWNRIVLDGISTIRLTPDEQKRYLLRDGDLLVCEGGEVGRSAIWHTNLPECYYQKALHRLRAKNTNAICIEYLLQLFHLYSTSGFFESSVTKTSIAHLPKDKLESILIPLPPLPEQRRIAAALSDADELVASLDKLIEKKKCVKEGAMQRLLSGETRLPGFTGKWVEKKLGECGPFRKGHGISREESHSGSIPAIRYGELYTTHHDIIREYPSRISKDVAKQAVLLKKGDILFACSGETKEEIGKSAAFVDTCEAYAGGDLLILSPGSDFDSAFLGYALNRSSCVLQKAAAGQGDAVVHIREESLKEVVVSLPPTLAEQRAIATMLSDMDAEIAALSRERAEAERIKQGMMQELLTGKVRLRKASLKN